jgi:hypothetical protein
MVGGGQTAGARPTVRNPILTLLLPVIIMFGGGIVASIMSAVDLGGVGGALFGLAYVAAIVVMFISVIKMVGELKAVTRNESFAWWPIIIPVYSVYWAWILVPQEVAKAKQMSGVQAPPRGIVVYIFLFLYAFAADLNDIAKAP